MSNVSVQFVEIKCVEHDLTVQTVITELETIASSFCKIYTNTCVHHVYSVNTSRTTWKHSHVYRVHGGCPRGHMLFITGRKTPCCRAHLVSQCSSRCQLHCRDACYRPLTRHSRVELPSETQNVIVYTYN